MIKWRKRAWKILKLLFCWLKIRVGMTIFGHFLVFSGSTNGMKQFNLIVNTIFDHVLKLSHFGKQIWKNVRKSIYWRKKRDFNFFKFVSQNASVVEHIKIDKKVVLSVKINYCMMSLVNKTLVLEFFKWVSAGFVFWRKKFFTAMDKNDQQQILGRKFFLWKILFFKKRIRWHPPFHAHFRHLDLKIIEYIKFPRTSFIYNNYVGSL